MFAIWQERRSRRGGAASAASAAFPVLLGVFAVAHLLWFTLATSDAWVRVVARFGSLWFA